MNKIIATIIKEWQVMRRDISGLMLLLAMPAALIVVMTLIQDAPFKDYQDIKFELLLVDSDRGSAAKQLAAGLKQSRNFIVTDTLANNALTEQELKKQLNDGHYKIGIIIPKGTTAEIVNSANIAVNEIAQKAGLNVNLPSRDQRTNVNIQLLFDPTVKPTLRNAITSALDKYIMFTCSGILMERMSLLSKGPSTENNNQDAEKLKRIMQGVGIQEVPLNDKESYKLHMNTVQHNVPAWAIFGMFFIVVPIAGHIIKEREDGSSLRIGLIPNALHYVTLGKIIFYTLICAAQFWIMMAIGMWAIPLLGLPALYPGINTWVLIPVSLCIGFSATSLGFFVGTLFKTVNQALPFGSVAIVILSALGGIWVPVEVLPHNIQIVALLSPLHWSLNAVNQVILRNGDFSSVLFSLSLLFVTGCLLWLAGIIANKRKQ